MNREIRFRAWDASEKEMVYFEKLIYDPDDWFLSLLLGENSDSDDVLMQFTGLHDKNGKEIWEGDIVVFINTWNNNQTRKSVVEFKDGAFTNCETFDDA